MTPPNAVPASTPDAGTVIPCKQPKVPVVDNKGIAATYCLVPGCEWKYGPGVKTDVEERATRHRGAHRDAVPATVMNPTGRAAEVDARCACGEHWIAPTRAHGRTWIRHHLELDHGLVRC